MCGARGHNTAAGVPKKKRPKLRTQKSADISALLLKAFFNPEKASSKQSFKFAAGAGCTLVPTMKAYFHHMAMTSNILTHTEGVQIQSWISIMVKEWQDLNGCTNPWVWSHGWHESESNLP